MPATREQLQTPIRLTDGQSNDQLLYFTSHSVSDDMKTIIVISDCDGDVNLYALDRATLSRRALTQNRDGVLWSYVYFDGRPHQGLGKASVSFDTTCGIVYYLQGDEIRGVSLSGDSKTLGIIGDDEVTAFMHASSDGRYLCVPTTQARALQGPLGTHGRPAHDIDKRVQDEGLCSWLNVYDTRTGERVLRERVERAWITHVQFSPVDPKSILYNHEWSADGGLRRIWLFDGKSHRPLRPMTEGRSKSDWACHEVWTPDGQAVVYHGGYANGGAPYLGRITLPDTCTEIPLNDTFRGYGHFTTSRHGRVVTDGYFRFEEDAPKSAKYIAAAGVDWDRKLIEWKPLCEHGSSWSSQDAHPHPIFDHDGKSVLFTSDISGKRAVYRVNA